MNSVKRGQLLLTMLVSIYMSAVATYLSQEGSLRPPQNTPQQSPPQVAPSNRQRATVTRIIDGDTIELSTGQKLRYIGIDTPEITGKDECYAQESAAKNTELVLNKQVELEKDVSETDRYGRLLRYVYLEGKMVNQTLVLQGYAKASTYPPDVKYNDLFFQAQNTAMTAKKGLWGPACATD